MSTILSKEKLFPFLKLARTEGIGSIRYHQLLQRYHTPEAALEALPSLKRSKDPNKKFHIPSDISISEEIDKTFEYSGQFILHGTTLYPPLLSMLDNAPPILITLGNPHFLHQKNVAIVGARNASIHGIKMAENLAADLSAHQIGVTSGLARGIDEASHRGALYTGFTIAAIGCGIDVVYPAEHKNLQQQIAQKGVIVTEFPIGTQPQSINFPRRNRLIAGLCWGCVVIEAAQHSGSLITAQLALQYNKSIFAVPGSPLDPRCKGSNNLLRSGAILTENATDILNELPQFTTEIETKSKKTDLFSYSSPSIPPATSVKKSSYSTEQQNKSIEEYILSLLSTTPVSVDLIIRTIPYSTTEILSTITLLEIQKKILLQHNGYILNQ